MSAKKWILCRWCGSASRCRSSWHSSTIWRVMESRRNRLAFLWCSVRQSNQTRRDFGIHFSTSLRANIWKRRRKVESSKCKTLPIFLFYSKLLSREREEIFMMRTITVDRYGPDKLEFRTGGLVGLNIIVCTNMLNRPFVRSCPDFRAFISRLSCVFPCFQTM